MDLERLGMFLVPSSSERSLERLDDSALPAALAAHALAARHVESITVPLEWERFTERVEKSAHKPWSALSPNERRRAAAAVLAGLPPSRRGGVETALADLLAEQVDEGAGLWVQPEPPEPEPAVEVSPAEVDRKLRDLVEEQRAAGLRAGPRAHTQALLSLLELPKGASGASRDDAVSEQQSQIVGEHETVKQLLELVPAKSRATRDVYTPARARALLAALDALLAKHGGEAKLAALLDKRMANLWPLASPRAESVALEPLRWFMTALREAVAHGNGFAIEFSTTLL